MPYWRAIRNSPAAASAAGAVSAANEARASAKVTNRSRAAQRMARNGKRPAHDTRRFLRERGDTIGRSTKKCARQNGGGDGAHGWHGCGNGRRPPRAAGAQTALADGTDRGLPASLVRRPRRFGERDRRVARSDG